MRKILILLAIVSASACSRSDNAATDTAGTTTAGATSGSMAGMDMANSDRDFLRMMSDHHEGLIRMASAAMTKASKPATQGDAHNLHTKQAAERDTMVAMLRTAYGDSYTPKVMPKNRAQNDSLQALSGANYDRTFYRIMIDHHREGVAMIDSTMPHLTKDDVKRKADRMKADQQKEITDFQRKASQ
ncbi:MAG: DUF305 domain-containing protein [Gemmatimonadaceae bacterium]